MRVVAKNHSHSLACRWHFARRAGEVTALKAKRAEKKKRKKKKGSGFLSKAAHQLGFANGAHTQVVMNAVPRHKVQSLSSGTTFSICAWSQEEEKKKACFDDAPARRFNAQEQTKAFSSDTSTLRRENQRQHQHRNKQFSAQNSRARQNRRMNKQK